MHVESKIQMWCESFPSVNGYNLPIEYVSKLSRVCVRERMCMNVCALVDNLLWLKPILSVTFHSIPFRFCTEAFFLPSNVIYLHFSFRMVLRKKKSNMLRISYCESCHKITHTHTHILSKACVRPKPWLSSIIDDSSDGKHVGESASRYVKLMIILRFVGHECCIHRLICRFNQCSAFQMRLAPKIKNRIE